MLHNMLYMMLFETVCITIYSLLNVLHNMLYMSKLSITPESYSRRQSKFLNAKLMARLLGRNPPQRRRSAVRVEQGDMFKFYGKGQIYA